MVINEDGRGRAKAADWKKVRVHYGYMDQHALCFLNKLLGRNLFARHVDVLVNAVRSVDREDEEK